MGTELSLLFLNIFTWGGGFKYLALSKRFFVKKFIELLGPLVAKWNGLLAENIIITRQPDEGADIVLKFSKIPVAVKDASGKHYSYYDVKLRTSNRDITLGEIDFSDLEKRKDCKIEVTLTGKQSGPLNKAVHEIVLEILKQVAKVSAAPGLIPSQKVVDVIAVDSWFLNNFFNVLRGKVIKQKGDTQSSQRQHLEEKSYVRGLIKIAREMAQKGDFTILDGYFGAIKRSLNEELRVVSYNKKLFEDEVKSREEEQERELRKNKIIRAAIVVTAILLVVGFIALIVLAPPVTVGAVTSGFLVGIVASIIGFFSSKISAGLNSIGFTALVVGIFTKGIDDYKETMLKEARKDLEKETKKELTILEKLDTVTLQQKVSYNDVLVGVGIQEGHELEYMAAIALKDEMLKCASKKDVYGFFKNYERIDYHNYPQVFSSEDDRKLINQIVLQDLGKWSRELLSSNGCAELNCENLIKVGKERRAFLLEICFSIGAPAPALAEAMGKAILVSNMLEILFKHKYKDNVKSPVFSEVACKIFEAVKEPGHSEQDLLNDCVKIISRNLVKGTQIPPSSIDVLNDLKGLLEQEGIYVEKEERGPRPVSEVANRPLQRVPKPLESVLRRQSAQSELPKYRAGNNDVH